MIICGVDLGTRKSAVSRLSVGSDRDDVPMAMPMSRVNAISLMVHPTQRANELHILATMTSEACEGSNYVFIEEPLVGRGVKASMGISQTAGAVMAWLGQMSIPTELVNVSHWKKGLLGKGNASKEDIEMWLSTNYPVYSAECDDQDQRDATCVALYGWQTLRSLKAGLFRDEVSDPRSVSGVEPS